MEQAWEEARLLEEREGGTCVTHTKFGRTASRLISLAAINMILSYCSALAVSLQSGTLSFALSHHFFL
jgi:hypothetical protein